MNVPKDLRFTRTHEWIRLEGNVAVVGITDFAQDQLSDLTYVELPSAGELVSAQDEVAVVESVKAASDIYSPIAGTIESVNDQLVERPELVNSDPYGEGWLFRLTPTDASDIDELLPPEQYEELLPD